MILAWGLCMVARTETLYQRAAIYCRVSSAMQETDGTSLETQEAAARAYCAANNYAVDESCVHRETYSGFEMWERKKLTLLRESIRQRGVDVVIAHAVDRLARNQAHLYIIAEEAERAGVRIEFVTERFDESAVGKFLRSAKAFAAEVEREKFKERSMRGKRARVATGRLLHGKTPLYGYAWADEQKDRYVVNPHTAPVVRRIFDEYVAGRSQRAVALGLTASGIPTPRGGSHWDYSTVGHILGDSRYAGDACAFRIRQFKENGKVRHVLRPREEWVELPEGVIPSIIEPDTFATVRDRLARGKGDAPRRLTNPEDFLLRRRARCGHCGYSMAAHNKTSRGKRTPTYICTRYSKGRGCTAHNITAKSLDAAAWERVKAVLLQPEIIEQELERLRAADPTAADLDAVDRRLAGVDRQIANLIGHLADLPPVAGDAVRQQVAALTQERETLLRERDGLIVRRAAWATALSRLGDVRAWCRTLAARLATLSFEDEQLAFDALDVQATVFRANHQPRYIITASLALGHQTGHDSIFSAESQNIHS